MMETLVDATGVVVTALVVILILFFVYSIVDIRRIERKSKQDWEQFVKERKEDANGVE